MADLGSEDGQYGEPQVLRWQRESPVVKRSKNADDEQEKAKVATSQTEKAEEELRTLKIEVTQQELDEVSELKKQIELDQSMDLEVLQPVIFNTFYSK